MKVKMEKLEIEIRKLKSMAEFINNSEGNEQMNKVFSLIKQQSQEEILKIIEELRFSIKDKRLMDVVDVEELKNFLKRKKWN